MLDIVIIVALVGMALAGLRKGLIAPLLGELGFVVALLISVRFHRVGAELLRGFPDWVVTPAMILALTFAFGFASRPLVGLIRTIPGVRTVDRYGGVVLNTLITFVVMYLLLGAILDFDANIYPTLHTGLVTAEQIVAYQKAVNDSPLAKQFSDDAELSRLRAEAARNPLPTSAFQQLDQFLGFYVHWIRDPLLGSSLAPIVNAVGAHIPLVGHERPWLRPFGGNHA